MSGLESADDFPSDSGVSSTGVIYSIDALLTDLPVVPDEGSTPEPAINETPYIEETVNVNIVEFTPEMAVEPLLSHSKSLPRRPPPSSSSHQDAFQRCLEDVVKRNCNTSRFRGIERTALHMITDVVDRQMKKFMRDAAHLAQRDSIQAPHTTHVLGALFQNGYSFEELVHFHNRHHRLWPKAPPLLYTPPTSGGLRISLRAGATLLDVDAELEAFRANGGQQLPPSCLRSVEIADKEAQNQKQHLEASAMKKEEEESANKVTIDDKDFRNEDDVGPSAPSNNPQAITETSTSAKDDSESNIEGLFTLLSLRSRHSLQSASGLDLPGASAVPSIMCLSREDPEEDFESFLRRRGLWYEEDSGPAATAEAEKETETKPGKRKTRTGAVAEAQKSSLNVNSPSASLLDMHTAPPTMPPLPSPSSTAIRKRGEDEDHLDELNVEEENLPGAQSNKYSTALDRLFESSPLAPLPSTSLPATTEKEMDEADRWAAAISATKPATPKFEAPALLQSYLPPPTIPSSSSTLFVTKPSTVKKSGLVSRPVKEKKGARKITKPTGGAKKQPPPVSKVKPKPEVPLPPSPPPPEVIEPASLLHDLSISTPSSISSDGGERNDRFVVTVTQPVSVPSPISRPSPPKPPSRMDSGGTDFSSDAVTPPMCHPPSVRSPMMNEEEEEEEKVAPFHHHVAASSSPSQSPSTPPSTFQPFLPPPVAHFEPNVSTTPLKSWSNSPLKLSFSRRRSSESTTASDDTLPMTDNSNVILATGALSPLPSDDEEEMKWSKLQTSVPVSSGNIHERSFSTVGVSSKVPFKSVEPEFPSREDLPPRPASPGPPVPPPGAALGPLKMKIRLDGNFAVVVPPPAVPLFPPSSQSPASSSHVSGSRKRPSRLGASIQQQSCPSPLSSSVSTVSSTDQAYNVAIKGRRGGATEAVSSSVEPPAAKRPKCLTVEEVFGERSAGGHEEVIESVPLTVTTTPLPLFSRTSPPSVGGSRKSTTKKPPKKSPHPKSSPKSGKKSVANKGSHGFGTSAPSPSVRSADVGILPPPVQTEVFGASSSVDEVHPEAVILRLPPGRKAPKEAGKAHYINSLGETEYFCPVCLLEDLGTLMIGCEECGDWYHGACVGVHQEPPDNEVWFCPKCAKSAARKGLGKPRKSGSGRH